MKTADVVLKNANVITMDAARPTAEAVVISGENIILVGGNTDTKAAVGAGTKIVDCGGRTVIPGFNDADFPSLFRYGLFRAEIATGTAAVAKVRENQ